VITVNAKTLADIIKTIDDDQLTLVIEESQQQMTVLSSSDEFKIK
jgi:DNA polymerase III sliding clamp (beta) subunit (PCNA family)